MGLFLANCESRRPPPTAASCDTTPPPGERGGTNAWPAARGRGVRHTTQHRASTGERHGARPAGVVEHETGEARYATRAPARGNRKRLRREHAATRAGARAGNSATVHGARSAPTRLRAVVAEEVAALHLDLRLARVRPHDDHQVAPVRLGASSVAQRRRARRDRYVRIVKTPRSVHDPAPHTTRPYAIPSGRRPSPRKRRARRDRYVCPSD